MMINRRWVVYCLIGIVVVSLGTCCWYLTKPIPTMSYEGEGIFRNTSWRFPWKSVGVIVGGYTLDLPKFDLAQEFRAEYRVGTLPRLERMTLVYLSICGSQQQLESLRKDATARVQIVVEDNRGNQIVHVDSNISEMTWAYPEGGSDCVGLYDLDKSKFDPTQSSEYLFRIHFSTNANVPNLKGFLHIRCGGSI